jgi:TPR repeat protein
MSDLASLTAAAEQGDAESRLTLGMLYQHGLGVGQDYAEAVKWFR